MHARHAYALARLGRTGAAATHNLQAILLAPQLSPWPLDAAAAQRGQKAAAAGDWPRATAEFELAVHQSGATFANRSELLLARCSAAPEDAPDTCRQLLDCFEKDARSSQPLVFACLVAACEEAEARRRVKLAEHPVAARRDAATLTWLGAALYRAGRFEEAARTLQQAIKAQGKGGSVDSGLFLALAQQRLGQGAEARANLARFETWLKGQQFPTWQEQTRWRLLHEETRRLILTMPRAER